MNQFQGVLSSQDLAESPSGTVLFAARDAP
jgi:hypothetical protein